MDKQAFKQRMQNLKSYRENNPGKGYWDWKVQAYQNGGRHALGVGQVFASLADMLFNKERRTPAIAAAAYYTIHQTQNDPVLAPVEAPLVEPIADAIKSVDETPYDPGEVFLLSPENQKKQMTKNPNYRVVDTNSEEDPYGIVRRAANYHKEIHGEVPVYEYIADSDTTIKRSNLIPVGTLPLGEYTPELPHAGSYNSVLYYNASNDKLYQRAYDLNDYGPTDTKDKGAKIPEQWESLEDADISELTNTFAYNMYQDPVQYMANGGEVDDPDDEFIQAVNTKLGRTPDGRPKEQGLKPVIDLEDAVNVTPIGDVLSAKDAYNAARNNDWLGVGLATATMIPFVPRAISTVRRSTPTVKNYRSSLSNALDKAVKLGEKERRMSARLNNETYETVQRLMDDPSYMRRAQQVKEKYGDDYTQIYADLIDAYNNSPELLPKAKRTAFEDNARARMATTTESTKRHMDGGEFPKMGEYEYQYDINGVPYGTTIHEMNHNADYLKNKAIDADANSNLYYWMRSALKPFSRIDPNTDKLTKYDSKPTEQKAYMNQLREFMYANKMIDTRDQIVTPDLIKQAISKLPKGMQSIKKASEQFKSMRSYTKWFNTIPLLGVGAVGANKYFTSNENRD